MTQTYKDLIVWQKAVTLSVEIYALTETFPKSEQFGLSSQMRRCAVSIPANIAEGSRRKGKNELKQFLSIAYGSGAELETYIVILEQLPFGSDIDTRTVSQLLEEVMRMLNTMINNLKNRD